MANQQKNEQIYDQFVEQMRLISTAKSPSPEFGKIVDRVYISFGNGFIPQKLPQFNYGAEIVKKLSNYSRLVNGRKSIVVAGSKRDITTETEAYETLKAAKDLTLHLVLPFVNQRTNFSNRMFHELSNLSFSCLESTVNGVAGEYIDREKAAEAKTAATDLARTAYRISDFYFNKDFSFDLFNLFKSFNGAFDRFPEKYLRSFETVAVAPKELVRKKECLEKVRHLVSEKDNAGQLKFRPEVICPIAQGGNEVGIFLANHYEDMGHNVLVYPLMYSIKTRKQRYPWIRHDGDFLAQQVKEQNVLLTEDWVTTGNTVRGILNELEGAFPREIRIATLKRDPEQSNVPILNKYEFYVGALNRYIGQKNDSMKDLKS